MEPMGMTLYRYWRRAMVAAHARRMGDVKPGTPEWEDLSPEEREAWETAANNLVDGAEA